MSERDVVAEPLEQGGGRANRGDAVGVEFAADRVSIEHPDAQPARVDAQLVDVWTARCRRDDAVADTRAVDRIEHPRGVAHRSADAQLRRQPGLVALGAHRHTTL